MKKRFSLSVFERLCLLSSIDSQLDRLSKLKQELNPDFTLDKALLDRIDDTISSLSILRSRFIKSIYPESPSQSELPY